MIYEGLLSDIDDNIKAGDKLVKEIDAEFKSIHKALKKLSYANDWEKAYTTARRLLYSHRWMCEKWMFVHGYNDCEGILIETLNDSFLNMYKARIYFITKYGAGLSLYKYIGEVLIPDTEYKNVSEFAKKYLTATVFKDSESLKTFIDQNYVDKNK
jgi:hypothetical protein